MGSYSEGFFRDCIENGVDRRVWVVADGYIYIAHDPMMNHEDLISEYNLSYDFTDSDRFVMGDIMNFEVRADTMMDGENPSVRWIGPVTTRLRELMALPMEHPPLCELTPALTALLHSTNIAGARRLQEQYVGAGVGIS